MKTDRETGIREDHDGRKAHGPHSDDAKYGITDNKNTVKSTQEPDKGPEDAFAESDITIIKRIRTMTIKAWLHAELRHLPATIAFVGLCILFHRPLFGLDLGPIAALLSYWAYLLAGAAVLVLLWTAWRWTLILGGATLILWALNGFI